MKEPGQRLKRIVADRALAIDLLKERRSPSNIEVGTLGHRWGSGPTKTVTRNSCSSSIRFLSSRCSSDSRCPGSLAAS